MHACSPLDRSMAVGNKNDSGRWRDRIGSIPSPAPCWIGKSTGNGITSQPKLSASFPKSHRRRRTSDRSFGFTWGCWSGLPFPVPGPGEMDAAVWRLPKRFRFVYSTLRASSSSLWPSFDRKPHTVFVHRDHYCSCSDAERDISCFSFRLSAIYHLAAAKVTTEGQCGSRCAEAMKDDGLHGRSALLRRNKNRRI
jgi:hypothetical protein